MRSLVKRISATDLYEKIDREPRLVVIDVLEPDEFREEHIPGTINIPASRDDLAEAVAERTGGKDRPVVLYCRGSDCQTSREAAQRLEEAGFTNVWEFAGGIEAWKAAHLAIERD